MAKSGTVNTTVFELMQPLTQHLLSNQYPGPPPLWGRKQRADKTMRIRAQASVREIITDYDRFLRNNLTLVAFLVSLSEASISLC